MKYISILQYNITVAEKNAIRYQFLLLQSMKPNHMNVIILLGYERALTESNR